MVDPGVLRVFSHDIVEIPRQGVRSGQRVATPPVLIPAKPVHAATPAATETLCGLSLGGLREFPDDHFPFLNPFIRCTACDAAAGHPDNLSTTVPR